MTGVAAPSPGRVRDGVFISYAREDGEWLRRFQVMLKPVVGGRGFRLLADDSWARAQQWRPDPEAERVSTLAEDRLRTLRPDVMERYDRLRTEGADPIEAMRRVANGFDTPPARTGQPAPVRAALPERDLTRRPGDAEIVRFTRRPGDAEIVRYRGPDAAATAVLGADSSPAAVVGASAAAEAPAAARSLTSAAAQAHRSPAVATVAGRAR